MNKITTTLLTLVAIFTLSATCFAKGFSQETDPAADRQENLKRTERLVDRVEEYLRANDTYVAVIARRGAGNPESGVSDTDNLDLTGMAHCGFVVRNGFGKNAGYITYNLVRIKDAGEREGKNYDLSELRVWSLPHFFIGAFEKDAIVFLPEKAVQLKLWNMLQANGRLSVREKKEFLLDENGTPVEDAVGNHTFITRQIITNGGFQLLHNAEYNLLSDYIEESTMNCNEHLLKTYISLRDHWRPNMKGYDINNMDERALTELRKKTQAAVKKNFIPRTMVISRTKSTFAFTQNIRFGESYEESPALFGLKLKKEKFDVVSVDSFCNPQNQKYLRWHDFKVFRESQDRNAAWKIEDWGTNYVKVNRFTGKKNTIAKL